MAALLIATVSDDDGNSFEVPVNTRAVLRWESTYPGRTMAKLNGSMRFTYELVYVAAKLPGVTLAEFQDRYDIEVPDEDEVDPTEADPTQPAA